MNVLVVEDERRIASFVRKGLEELGFTVDVRHDGNEAFDRALSHAYDAIVLDIMLPGRDGLSILRGLRERRNAVPVLLLTARGELHERVEGLETGADDYLTKPFFIEELGARLHALIRRASGRGVSRLEAGPITMDHVSREVRCGGGEVELTPREFGLLEYLMRSPGRVLTRTQILEHVWGYDFDPQTNLVDVYIQRIRKKLAGGGTEPPIETVRGVGYRIPKPE